MNKISCVFILVSVLLILTSCSQNRNNAQNQYTVYLPNKEMSQLNGFSVQISGKNLEEKIQNILAVLKSGEEDALPAIPNGIEIQSIKIEKGNVVLNLNELYNDLAPIDEIICRSAIVKSLTELSEVNSVEFYIGSIPYATKDGVVVGVMKGADIILDFDQQSKESDLIPITLYFADENAEFLIPVEETVSKNTDEQLEVTVLKLLIAGPNEDEMVPTIPEGTVIRNVSTKEGVCYVDFSEEFVTKHMGGSAGEMMTIYSIVNTLTDLPNINTVQFLIEGTIREEYKGHYQFNGLFKKNLDIIKK